MRSCTGFVQTGRTPTCTCDEGGDGSVVRADSHMFEERGVCTQFIYWAEFPEGQSRVWGEEVVKQTMKCTRQISGSGIWPEREVAEGGEWGRGGRGEGGRTCLKKKNF